MDQGYQGADLAPKLCRSESDGASVGWVGTSLFYGGPTGLKSATILKPLTPIRHNNVLVAFAWRLELFELFLEPLLSSFCGVAGCIVLLRGPLPSQNVIAFGWVVHVKLTST